MYLFKEKHTRWPNYDDHSVISTYLKFEEELEIHCKICCVFGNIHILLRILKTVQII